MWPFADGAAKVDCTETGLHRFPWMHAARAGKGAGGGDRQRYQSWAMDAIFRLFTLVTLVTLSPFHPFTLVTLLPFPPFA